MKKILRIETDLLPHNRYPIRLMDVLDIYQEEELRNILQEGLPDAEKKTQ
uniref:Uncharacterized protein n=1 Tax=viral metagenome TaxID=1070528 RepID=A0A6H1ZQ01_9ZZZZ